MQRGQLIKQVNEIGKYLADLKEEDCRGIPIPAIKAYLNIFRNILELIMDAQKEMSVDRVAKRYGVTNATIYNWLFKHQLPKPKPILDKNRTCIDRDTINTLDQHYKRQDI